MSGASPTSTSATGTHFAGRTHIVGGTSAVAPLWAAFVAQLNEDLAQTPGFPEDARAGYLTPLLYQTIAPAGFNAVSEGTNGYPAEPGWDPCTGYGSPDGVRLIAALNN